jgi:exo-beta-1,3-glucanase (GH17 family)
MLGVNERVRQYEEWSNIILAKGRLEDNLTVDSRDGSHKSLKSLLADLQAEDPNL